MSSANQNNGQSDDGAVFVLNDEQQMLKSTARKFVDTSAPASRLRDLRDAKDETGYSPAVWSEMAELGWLGLQLPEQYEGLDLGFFDLCVVLEQCGRQLMPEPIVSTLLLGAQALLLGGSDAQKSAWLPKIAEAEAVVTLAFDERGARGDASKIKASATRTADGYVLDGVKIGVLDGHVADAIIVAAREEGDVSLFLVDPSSDGVDVKRHIALDLRNASTVTLSGASVGEDARLTGDDLLERVLDRARIGVAAESLGAMEKAFADTVDYIKERVQFDRPLGSFQALQHRAARLYIEIALARSTVLAAARSVDRDDDTEVRKLASLAKATAAETFNHVAKEAIQMHGGIGMTDEHDIGFYLKRAQTVLVSFGDTEYHRARWAELNGY